MVENLTLGSRAQTLWALDQGAYGPAIALYEAGEMPSKGPAGHLWRADVATYLWRFDEAERELELAATGEPELECRRDLIAAEIDLLNGRYEGLRERFVELGHRALVVGSRLLEARVAVDRARLARMVGDDRLALDEADEAVIYAREAHSRYLAGAALFNRATALADLDRTDEALDIFERAITDLAASENLRTRAMAENGYSGLLAASGQMTEAINVLTRAEATMLDLGLVQDTLIIRTGFCTTLFAAGKTKRARQKALEIIEMARAVADARSEIFGLRQLVCIECASGDMRAAFKVADEFSRLVDARGNDSDRIDARMLSARVRAKAGDYDALADLDNLIKELDASGDKLLGVTARLCRVDALMKLDLPRAYRAYQRALARMEAKRGMWIQAELAALARTWALTGIRREGRFLVVDLEGDLPTRLDARDILEYELISNALARSKGRYAPAGRLIGEKRWNMMAIAKKIDKRLAGSPTRPVYTINSADNNLPEEGADEALESEKNAV